MRSRTQIEYLEEDLDELMADSRQQADSPVIVTNTSGSGSLLLGLLLMAIISFIAFMAFDMLQAIHQAWLMHPSIAVILSLIGATFGLLLIWVLWRETYSYLRLGKMEHSAQQWQQAWQNHDQAAMQKHLKQLIKQQRHSHQAWPLVKAFEQSVQPHHSAEQAWFMYDTMVAKPLFKQAKALINKEAMQAGAVGLLSLNNLMETLVLLWRSARVVKLIAQLYGYQPGLVANIKLLKISLQNVMIQQTADMLVEEGVNMLGKGLLSGLSQQAGKAASTGVLVKRIGHAAHALIAPFNNLKGHVEHEATDR